MHFYPYILFPSEHLHYSYLAEPLYGVTEGLKYHDSPGLLSKCRTAATVAQVSDYKPEIKQYYEMKYENATNFLHSVTLGLSV
jgi:hypothetical protein